VTRPSRALAFVAIGGALTLTAACSGGGSDEEPPASESSSGVTASLLPPIAQAGADVASADDAEAVIAARTEPAEEGVELTLEQDAGSGWEEVGTAETNAAGTADFVVSGGTDASYRVSADGGAPSKVSGTWTLESGDEFDGDALDPAQWYHRGGEYNPEGLRACSKGSPDAVDVSGGALALRVQVDPDRAGESCEAKAADGKSLGRFPYRLNGHVASTKLFRYGVTAARIKFQPARGQHGSFWFQSQLAAANHEDAASGGAEIDVVEYFGRDDDDRLASFVYYPSPDGMAKEGDWIEEASRFLTDQDDDWFKRYHVFALEWTEDEYVVRIDGQEAWRTDKGVSQQPEFVVLSLLSSDYELPKLKGAPLPQTMSVDWVRHWSLG
jgi:beta-glucanase (GH16 family)